MRNLPALRHLGRRGARPDPATLHWWCTSGVRLPSGRRVRLESWAMAGRRVTSRAAVGRFLAALNATGPAPVAEAIAAKAAHERAEAELLAAGI